MTDELDNADAPRLAALLRSSDAKETDWHPDELAAIYAHQMNTLMRVDLGSADPDVVALLAGGPANRTEPLATFADLLKHASPPVLLLRSAKEFAKSHRNRRDRRIPSEVATALYYAAIAAALVNCNQRISHLTDATLADGFTWLAEQAWVDEPTMALARAALARHG